MYENYTLFVLAVEYNESSKILIKWDKFLPKKRKTQKKGKYEQENNEKRIQKQHYVFVYLLQDDCETWNCNIP